GGAGASTSTRPAGSSTWRWNSGGARPPRGRGLSPEPAEPGARRPAAAPPSPPPDLLPPDRGGRARAGAAPGAGPLPHQPPQRAHRPPFPALLRAAPGIHAGQGAVVSHAGDRLV